MTSVWLVTENAAFQGDEVHGIFTTRELAEAHVQKVIREAQEAGSYIPKLEIDEQPLDTPINLWMGN